jgi:hypothetical protein
VLAEPHLDGRTAARVWHGVHLLTYSTTLPV